MSSVGKCDCRGSSYIITDPNTPSTQDTEIVVSVEEGIIPLDIDLLVMWFIVEFFDTEILDNTT